MTFSPDSPELTAYLLGELDPETRAALEAALQQSPELASELNSLSQVLGVVSEAFAAEPAVGLSPAQHQRVMEALPAISAASLDRASVHQREARTLWSAWTEWLGWRGGFVLAGGLAAATAVGFFLTSPRREVAQTLALAESLRYQPDWKPTSLDSLSNVAAPANPVVPALPTEAIQPAPVATSTAAPASAPAPAAEFPVPALAKRYGLQTSGEAHDTVVESRAKTEAHWEFQASAPATTVITGPLSPSSASGAGVTPMDLPPGATARGLSRRDAPLSLSRNRQAQVERETLSRGEQGVAMQGRFAITAGGRGGAGPSTDLASATAGRSGIRPWGERSDVEVGLSDFYKRAGEPSQGLADSLGEGVGFRGADARSRSGLAGEMPPRSEALGLRFAEANAPSTAFAPIQDNPFQAVTAAPLSTFGMDVDTGSYSLIRRMLRENSLPPGDAVRLEELLNYFSYDYPQPKGDHPLGASVEVAACPWNESHKLVRIGVKAREVPSQERPRSNLVFLLDVSGSMSPETRLPLVKRAMRLLIERLSPRDTVGIVTYAGEARVALEPVAISDDGRRQVTEVLDGLKAGSGTHGSAGILNAYAMATNHFIPGGVNRVILCTDGDFNVGVTDQDELLSLITARAKSGVFLSVLGFGMDNLKDSTLELLADKGNGNYAYIDSFAEARKVLVKQMDGTLVTVAKDAKIQVEFNPARVSRYRLLGYEKRLLRDRDFNDDTKDAGDVGAGHSVTVLYEIEPVGGTGAGVDPLRYAAAPTPAPESRSRAVHVDELLNLKIRYKQPDGQTSRLMEMPVKDRDHDLARASTDFKFAAAVVGYGMLLRQSPHAGSFNWEQVLRLAEQGQGNDVDGYRAEFIDLVRRAQSLRGQP